MKVKELIRKLKTFDENLTVVVDIRGCEVRDFELEDNGVFCHSNGKYLIVTYSENEDEDD